MTKRVSVKICGLTSAAHVDAAARAGAAYGGFVFFAKSPRHLSLAQARALALHAPAGLAKVALVVDADNAFLDDLTAQVPLDMLQLHGHETPERVLAVKARYGLPVMKAVGVADASDLVQPRELPQGRRSDCWWMPSRPRSADLPGGNGLAFDWRLIAGRRWPIPWMLAGGLSPQNVAEAIAMTGARQVDVSSGVESAPGVKDAARISAFVAAAQA